MASSDNTAGGPFVTMASLVQFPRMAGFVETEWYKNEAKPALDERKPATVLYGMPNTVPAYITVLFRPVNYV